MVSWVGREKSEPMGERIVVDAPRPILYQLPITLDGSSHDSFQPLVTRRTEGTYVAVLRNGRFWGRYSGFTFDAAGNLIRELSRDNWYAPRHSALCTMKLPRRRHITGTVACLCSPYAINSNYGHWLMDILPQFDMLLRSGIKLDEIDFFVMRYAGHRYQRESLELLGIPEGKLIQASDDLHLSADRLLMPFVTSDGSHIAKEGCDFVRGLFLGSAPRRSTGRLLYSSRNDVASRRVLNEPEVLGYLKGLGFEDLILSGMSVREQAATIFDAKALIGATGSNLTNILFAPRGGALVEIFSPGWVNRFQWYICNHIDVRFAYLVSQGQRPPDGKEMRFLTEDVVVDLDELARMCRLLGLA